MVDDFEDFFKDKSRCSLNTYETRISPTFPVFRSEHAYVDWVSQRNSVICILFLGFERLAVGLV